MQLLDFYKARYGTAVRHQGNGWNGPCPLCGGEPGKSDRFMVWPEREESLGQTCAEHGIKGIWSCRQCGASGDTIAYLMKIDGHDFKSALGELGIEGGRQVYHRRRAPEEPRQVARWRPKIWPLPSEAWCLYASKLTDEAADYIWRVPQALSWLAARGIDEQAVKTYRIGYLPPEGKYPGRWRDRSALGLEPRTGDDGKVRNKIFIPRGIVIPSFDSDGRVKNIRIRRLKTDLGERRPKYMELEGSCKGPMLLQASSQAQMSVYFVVEAELDAILIHHTTKGYIGALAVRTNRGKPDASSHISLRNAMRICISLDYDPAGAEGVEFWEQTYPSSRRWPTPEGKDPGDAFRLGVDIYEWISAALPESIRLGERLKTGQMDKSLSGQKYVGGEGESGKDLSYVENITQDRTRGAEETCADAQQFRWAIHDDFTDDELRILKNGIPDNLPLGMFPYEVCKAYLLWRGIPAKFVKKLDDEGNSSGFGWDFDYSWRKNHEERFQEWWQYQDKADTLWIWMSEHPDLVIDYHNLLHFWRLR